MEIAPNTSTKDRQIGDFLVKVPQPYTEGQTISAGEAAALNQVLAENTSNNLRKKLADGTGEGDNQRAWTDEEAQGHVDSYIAEYEMGVRSGGGRVADPIEREARRLATEKAKEVVRQKGMKLKEVDIGQISDAIYDGNVEALTTAAKAIVAARTKAENKASDGIDVSSLSFG